VEKVGTHPVFPLTLPSPRWGRGQG
jgi:hypothetical protein